MLAFSTSARAWLIFAVMASASLISSLQQVGLAVVSGEVAASLSADAASLGLLTAAFFFTYAAMQLPAGLLIDSFSSRKSVPTALLCAALGTFLFAHASSISTAVSGRVLTGIGLAMIQVPFLKLIAVWFPPEDFGKVTALSFVIGALGFCAATTPMAWANERFGWRISFTVIAAMLILLAVLVWIIVRDTPQKNVHSPHGSLSLRGIADIFKHVCLHRQLWLLGLWYFIQGGIYYSLVGLWGGQFLMQVHNLTTAETGLILSPAAAALITAPLFTSLTSRMKKRRPILLMLPLASLLLSLPLLLNIQTASKTVLTLHLFLLATAGLGGAAVVFDAATALFPRALSGTVCGFINIFPLIGGALFQFVMGLIIHTLRAHDTPADSTFAAAFLLYAAGAGAALFLGWRYCEASLT